MRYVSYTFNYKDGTTEKYEIEIEPHEEKESVESLNSINDMIYESMTTGKNGSIGLNAIEGMVYIRVSEIKSFVVYGLE